MNGVDVLSTLFLVLNAALGAARGTRRGFIDLCSVVFGILGGLLFYPIGQWLFGRFIGLPDLIAGPMGFALAVAGVVLTISILGRRFAEAEQGLSWPSHVGGAVFGLVLGMIGLVALLPLAGMRWLKPQTIMTSPIGSRFIAAMPLLYEAVERLGLDVPKVVMVPDDFEDEINNDSPRIPRFRPINFTALDHSTCIKCGGDVRFVGYFFKEGMGIYPFPKFVCSQCGRTSDGCQTYEGFHKMYDECPVKLAQDGGKLDCGVWSNGEMVIPTGPCPVCGRVLVPKSAYAE